jgi:hypothetical protein
MPVSQNKIRYNDALRIGEPFAELALAELMLRSNAPQEPTPMGGIFLELSERGITLD